MSIYEYDEELHMKTTREEGYEDGYASGKVDGYNSGLEAGRECGYASGKATGIQGAITALRSLETPDTVIIEKIATIYHINEEETRNYMNNN